MKNLGEYIDALSDSMISEALAPEGPSDFELGNKETDGGEDFAHASGKTRRKKIIKDDVIEIEVS